MTFGEAKREFEIRLYLWAKTEWEREINESFPNLRAFRSGAAWEVYQFMQQLDRVEQMTLALGLVKRYFPGALEALGDESSTEEESLRFRREEFFRIRDLYQLGKRLQKNGQMAEAQNAFQKIHPAAVKIISRGYFNKEESLASQLESAFRPIATSLEEKIFLRIAAGEKIKFASKLKLKNTLIRKFKSVFVSHCIGPEYLIKEPEPQFQMKVCGWILTTIFFMGRDQGTFEYVHNISSENVVKHQGPEKTYMDCLMLGQNLSFCSWLGITGATRWKYLVNEDVEAACEVAMKFCGHFFEIAPKLLKGLEFDKITSE